MEVVGLGAPRSSGAGGLVVRRPRGLLAEARSRARNSSIRARGCGGSAPSVPDALGREPTSAPPRDPAGRGCPAAMRSRRRARGGRPGTKVAAGPGHPVTMVETCVAAAGCAIARPALRRSASEPREATMLVFEDRVDAGRHLVGKLDFLAVRTSSCSGCPGAACRRARRRRSARRAARRHRRAQARCALPTELAHGRDRGGRDEGRRRVAGGRVGSPTRSSRRSNAASAPSEPRVERLCRGRGGSTWRPGAVVVDDGIATGSTARVACLVARQLGAGRGGRRFRSPRRTRSRLLEAETVVCVGAEVLRPWASTTPTSRRRPTTMSSRCWSSGRRVRPADGGG